MAAQSGTARSAVARAVPTATNVSGGPTAPSPPPAALAGPSRPVAAVPVARATQVAPNQEKVPMAKPVPTPLNSSARISDLPVSPVIVELAATTSEKSAASSGIPTATVVPLDAIEAQTQPLGADVSSSQEATQATLLAPTSDDEDNDDLALELLELVDEISGRGADVTPQDLSDVLEIVGDLEISDWADTNWDRSPHLAGAWGLRFTNSKAFHLNGGITGYARDIKGVQTPELIMKVQTTYRLLTFEEEIEYQQGSIASFVGNLAGASSITAECSWAVGSANQLLINAIRLVAGGRNWEPADKQAKALRVLGACTPAYIDEDLLVLRGQIEDVVFIFEKRR